MVYRTILDALGNTPLIELNHMTTPDQARIVVKYEGLNVGGSIKTRTALQMIEGAEARGIIGPDSIIVEPTSGNQGIGLALVCAVKDYKAVLIMPDSVSHERHELVRQYGAEVIMVHDEGDIGECIARCIALANEMAENDPQVYIPQQFENADNLGCARNRYGARDLARYRYADRWILRWIRHGWNHLRSWTRFT